jgi:prephenate dehydrogenase
MKTLAEMRVLIVGLGQIGGSLGMDLVRGRLVSEVVGYDAQATVAEEAVRLGAADRAAASLEEDLPGADLVILAVPIREIENLLSFVSGRLRDGAAVLDVGSTKSDICKAAARLPVDITWIGIHPLAGSEKCGLGASEAGKFEGAVFAVVPPPEETRAERQGAWLEVVEELIRAVGGRPVTVTAEEHDRLVAVTSNLPYVLAEGLMHLAARRAEGDGRLWDLVGGSFRSATRVAQSPADLTLDMFLTNRGNIADAIDDMVAELSRWKAMIASGDEEALRPLIEDVKRQTEVTRNE